MNLDFQNFIPILLGSDRNVYGMAVAFHQKYNIKSIALGKVYHLETADSNIMFQYKNTNIENSETFVNCLITIFKKYKNKHNKLILIACSDVYMKLVIKNKTKLLKYFLIPYIDEELMNKLVLKEEFYKTCEKYNLDYPKTLICTYQEYKNFNIPFDFPIIIKPSNSVSYMSASFDNKKKIFLVKDLLEAKKILNLIYSSSYRDNLIIQEYIPGDDTNLRVLNAYVNQKHKVTFMGLGQVLLEDKNPLTIGDYGAIISTFDKELFLKIQEFLEKLQFVGYANFDFKYDVRDKKYKLLEINIRQGRSSSFITISGKNIIKYLVDDFIYNKECDIEYLDNKYLWTIVPKGVILKYLKNDKLKKEVKKLYHEKKVGNILFYKKDFNIKRYIKIKYLFLSNYIRYKKYY